MRNLLPDTFAICEDSITVVDVQANDSDPDGDRLFTYIIIPSVNGTDTVLGGDSIRYTPNANFFGWDSLTYMVCDTTPANPCGSPTTLCDTAIAWFEVLSISDGPPVATPDTVSVCEDDSITVDVTTNDIDPDGLPLLPITILTPPDSGTATVIGSDSIKYVPNPNFFGNDTIFYEVCDSAVPSACDPGAVSLCDTGMVVITVEFVNDKPISIIDSTIVCEDDSVVVDVQANDSDPADGNILYTYIITGPDSGIAIVLNNDSIQYNPNPNFFGWNSLTYMVCDSTPGSACNPDSVLCDTATVYFETLNISDGGPIANPDTVSVCEDDSITVDVTANDSDPDGLPLLAISLITPPDSGTATVIGADSIKYVPNPNFFGNDTIYYEVCDVTTPNVCDATPSLCDTGMVVITVEFVNDKPISIIDSTIVCEDDSVVVDVQANDSDPADGNILYTYIITGPDSGTAIVLNGDSIQYNPNINFFGWDSLTYMVCDSTPGSACNPDSILCDTAIVWFEILNVSDGPPITSDDTANICEDDSITVDVKANDFDPDGFPLLAITIITPPDSGTAVVVGTDSIKYVPNPNFFGNDTVIYQVCDVTTPNACDSTPSQCDTAIVIVTVGFVNDTPIAVSDPVITCEDSAITVDVQANDIDVDLDTLTTTILSGPNNGTVTLLNGDSIFYDPDSNFTGYDTIIYVICDNTTGSLCNTMPVLCDTALLIINVGGVNDPPIAVNDSVGVCDGTPLVIDVQANDIDVDGDTLTTSLWILPDSGIAVVVPTNDSIQYTPNPGFTGLDTLFYIICDTTPASLCNVASSTCDTAWVILEVLPRNSGPVSAITDTAFTCEDSAVLINVQGNDINSGSAVMTTTIIIDPDYGSASLVGNDLLYTPNTNYVGQDTILYQICTQLSPCDTILFPLCDLGVVVITISAVNDPPVAVMDLAQVCQSDTVIFDVQANDINVDNDTFQTAIIAGPNNGTAIPINGDSIRYIPNNGFSGLDTIIYRICDSALITACNPFISLCDTDILIINVIPLNQAPVVNNNIQLSMCMNDGLVVDINSIITDPDGDSVMVNILGSPNNGVAGVFNNDTIVYTPNKGYAGDDTVTAIACDVPATNCGILPLCDTLSIVVNISDADSCLRGKDTIVIPNGFSPNGDGVNDKFDIADIIDKLDTRYPEATFTVFNRWGNNVFDSKKEKKMSWDGKRKGKDLPDGTYFYILYLDNIIKPITGYIELHR